MPGLKLQVTTAGRAALVNAPNTGTNPVLISHVGLANAPFSASAALTALPSEIKRLAAVGGTVTADDTIHVSIRDESDAVYDCYGFGLYLSNGTLFAVYSQQTLLLGKAAAAMMLLAVDAVFADIDVKQIAFGATNFTDPAATTEVAGIVELASEDEAAAGTDKIRVITAWLLKKVLDARLGAGAPSAFIRGLLGLTSAALLRTALELKGAALRDEGAGNNLDADKLDGQHGTYYRAWENLTGVPATASAWPSWDQVANKPQTFIPSDHSHANYVAKAGDVMTGQLTAPRLGINISGGAQGAFDALVSSAGRVLMRDYGNGTPVLDFVNAANNAWVAGRIRTGGNPLHLETTQVAVSGAGSFAGSMHADSLGSASGYFISKSNVTVLGAEGGASIYLRPNGAFNSTAEAVLNTAGSLLLRPTVSQPGNGINSFAHLSSGSFGGGFGLIDGAYNIGFWSENGYLRIGMATNNGALQQRMGLTPSGALSAVGGFDFGSSRKLKNIIGALPYGLAEVEQVTTLLGRYKEQYNPDGRVRLFFDAEQLLEVMPETVDAHGVSFDGELVPSVHIDQLLPVAFNAIKQLSTAVRRLQADLADLRPIH
ncbi:hypothetical protein [Xanthomonas citri]|uniref:Peptidase S74 domain-containing protein n=1 Tax=Xanthomonas campestris pv. glycines TaxID=473421 RepID=A0AAX0HYG6_XANCG|nr:hypothetical protein [Xanthomonas citri]ARV24865.1 hypothetical protein A9D66_20220 [Xanthomonas citri pv. glycines str. 12-2]OEY89253.1 hypothetical protein BIY41_19425 [Xanthomonas citri pv. glycines]OOX00322.1 hypothetical protein Xgly_19600 [Xanthomonas citri pv. glycines]QDS21870.1 hypothetical protein FPL05_21025 [Xanthomonas citri pv. glycines]QEQ75148.1 hypothetical protein C2859_20970 [Xanthomonas citri pv. glycines]